MIFQAILFWLTALTTVVGALGVVFSPRPAHAVLSLLVTFFGIAVAFYALGAPVIAAMQIIIYAGAVIVLFLFVVMLLDLKDVLPSLGGARGALAALSVAGCVALATAVIAGLLAGSPGDAATRPAGDARTVGIALYSDHVLMVLLIAILLTAAADGVVGLTRRHTEAAR